MRTDGQDREAVVRRGAEDIKQPVLDILDVIREIMHEDDHLRVISGCRLDRVQGRLHGPLEIFHQFGRVAAAAVKPGEVEGPLVDPAEGLLLLFVYDLRGLRVEIDRFLQIGLLLSPVRKAVDQRRGFHRSIAFDVIW